jgi:glycosyltransferase involved in cell wall biosynthesis
MNNEHNETRVSVIIPVGNRQSDASQLYSEYKVGLRATGLPHEFIFVLDGPRPEFAARLQQLMHAGEEIKVLNLTRMFGEATALMAGFEHANGNVILTLPAYHQIDPTDISKLMAGLNSADVCIGRRWPRIGGALEVFRRKAFHNLVSSITGVRVSDVGCGARALKRQVLEEISLYGDQHRFVAILANGQGFKVTEVDVRQSPRDRFNGIYHPKAYAHGVLDIFTVFFLVRFTKKPLRFFGMIGVTIFSIGMLVLLMLIGDRIIAGTPLQDRPALLLSSLLVVLGLQLFALGLLGELIIFTHAKSIKDYQVAEVIQYAEEETGSSTNFKDESDSLRKPPSATIKDGIVYT